MSDKETILFYVETVAVIIIFIFSLISVSKASFKNGRLELCNEIDMVYTQNEDCITKLEFENFNEMKPLFTDVGLYKGENSE